MRFARILGSDPASARLEFKKSAVHYLVQVRVLIFLTKSAKRLAAT
jgi:hypothetical protein